MSSVEYAVWSEGSGGYTYAGNGGQDNMQYVAMGAFTGNDGLPSGAIGPEQWDQFVIAIENKTTQVTHHNMWLNGGGNEKLVMIGGNGDDHILANDCPGTATLWGGAGDDTIVGGRGDDTISPGSGNDMIDGREGTNTLTYFDAKSGVTVNLTQGLQDTGVGTQTISNISNLVGSDQNDHLTGDANANQIDGGGGKDTINGGGGADTLIGGAGKDHFVFTSGATADGVHLSDLENRDVIDLSGIDANTDRSGNQRFHLVDTFDGHAQELLVHYDGTNTTIQGDTNGDGVADFTITAAGDHHDFSHFAL